VLLPDKRVELTEKKKKKQNEEQDFEEEEEDIDPNEDKEANINEDDIGNEDSEINDDLDIDMPSDYNQIKAKDVKAKLIELTDEAQQNHNILILQNIKLQELVKHE